MHLHFVFNFFFFKQYKDHWNHFGQEAFYNKAYSKGKSQSKMILSAKIFIHILSVVSCFEFQLEKLWADILTCIQSRHCGPYNSDLLTIMSPLLVRCNTLHSGFSHLLQTSYHPHPSASISTLFLLLNSTTESSTWQIISFLQEVTLGHPKRNIKNHAVMFWNATFAHSQTLKYPENLRYVLSYFLLQLAFLDVLFKL